MLDSGLVEGAHTQKTPMAQEGLSTVAVQIAKRAGAEECNHGQVGQHQSVWHSTKLKNQGTKGTDRKDSWWFTFE